jgi:hypothetical protein
MGDEWSRGMRDEESRGKGRVVQRDEGRVVQREGTSSPEGREEQSRSIVVVLSDSATNSADFGTIDPE